MYKHKPRGKWRVDWIVGGIQQPGKSFNTRSEARGYAEGKMKMQPDPAVSYTLVKEH